MCLDGSQCATCLLGCPVPSRRFRGEQVRPWGAGVCGSCRMRKVVLIPNVEWIVTLCLKAFAFAPSYEGTGRSLSLKLIQQLRQQSAQSQISTTAENKTTTTARLASGTCSSNALQHTASPFHSRRALPLVTSWVVPNPPTIRFTPQGWRCFSP